MRKWNGIIAFGILVLFLVHAIWGSLELSGMTGGGKTAFTALSHTMVVLIALHIAIGTKLTFDSIRAAKKAGVSYFKENKLFWIRRISGFAAMFFILFHVLVFSPRQSGAAFRLHFFGIGELIFQILLAATLALHVLTNIRPLMLALGSRKFWGLFLDILLVLAVLFLLFGVAFVVYFIRWQAF